MPFHRPLVTLLVAILLLLASPMGILAQPSPTRERLQPDFSAGFQLPNRDTSLPKEGRDKKPPSNWRQFRDGESANTGWASRSKEKGGERSGMLRLQQRGAQGTSAVLRRWAMDPDSQESGTISPVDGKETAIAADDGGKPLPAARVPADLRGGYGAVLKGRPVAPEQP